MKKNDVKHVFRYFDYGDADAFAQYLRATAATFPLTFEDLGIEHPSIESVYHDRSASFLASMESWRVSATEFVPEIDRTVPALTILDYEVYRSEFEWILKKIVEEKKNIPYENWSQARDVSAAWNAEEALQRTSETGEVKIIVHRGKSVLLIYVNHVLTQEQIQIFIDKLGV